MLPTYIVNILLRRQRKTDTSSLPECLGGNVHYLENESQENREKNPGTH